MGVIQVSLVDIQIMMTLMVMVISIHEIIAMENLIIFKVSHYIF